MSLPSGQRRKVGRPKHKQPWNMQMVIPKDVLMNQAKRSYWLVRQLEAKMSKDITSVKAKDYLEAVQSYADLCNQLMAKGYKPSHNGVATKRVDKQRLDTYGQQDAAPGVGENGSVELGTGIPAANPLA